MTQTATPQYRLMRGWRDGESMTQHLIAEYDDLNAAVRGSDVRGGYIERVSDGAMLVSAGQWIDAETGEVK